MLDVVLCTINIDRNILNTYIHTAVTVRKILDTPSHMVDSDMHTIYIQGDRQTDMQTYIIYKRTCRERIKWTILLCAWIMAFVIAIY